MMNKIILDKERIINLTINKNSICNITKYYNINELNITLEDNIKLIINHYDEINKKDLKINILEKNNSEFIYNHNFITNKEYNLEININLIGNNSKNEINIKGISDSGKNNILVNGSVNKNTNNNELYENIKLININDGNSYIYPNMFIDTKNVLANHSASITNINEDYLFYLNSKGISNVDATKLIIDGFLKNDAKD